MFKTLLYNVKIETLMKREIHARIALVEDVTLDLFLKFKLLKANVSYISSYS